MSVTEGEYESKNLETNENKSRPPLAYFIGYIVVAVAIIAGLAMAGFEGAANWALYLSVIGLVFAGFWMTMATFVPLYAAVLFIPLFLNEGIALAFLPDRPAAPVSTEVLDIEALEGFLGLSRSYRVKTPEGIYEIKRDVFAPKQIVTTGYISSSDGLAEVEVICSHTECFRAVNR